MPVPNLKSLVARIRKEYPAKMSKAQIGEAVYRIASEAQRMGYDIGVLLKRSGYRVPSPVGEISADILVDIPDEQEYDVFTNADGAEREKPQAGPVWNKLKSKVGGAHSGASMKNVRRPAVAVPEPTPEPSPAPVPDPGTNVPDPGTSDPQPCQCAEVVELLAAMELRAEERHEAVLVALHGLMNAHRLPRQMHGKAGWLSISGQVDGVEA